MLRVGKCARFICLAGLLFAAVMVLHVHAEEEISLSYSVDAKGTAVITGVEDAPVGAYSIPTTVDGYSVTAIGEGAFADCDGLTKVVIPEGVTELGDCAFMGCTSLEEVILPEGLTTLPADVFAGCESLTSIVIPEGVTEIGTEAFYQCEQLAEVTFPSTLLVIQRAAFCNCPSLKAVTLPSGIQEIREKALGYQMAKPMEDFTIYGEASEVMRAYAAAGGFTYVVEQPEVAALENAALPAEPAEESIPTTEPEEISVDTAPPIEEESLPALQEIDSKVEEAVTTPLPDPEPAEDPTPQETEEIAAEEKETAQIRFTDVAEDTWYTQAVQWAIACGITQGTGNGQFSPMKSCTRAEIVTFLWRQAGSPKAAAENPFSDVQESAWYYDAVLWAVENEITIGTGNGCFSPNKSCTRAEIVRFLWNQAGKPAVLAENPFADVAEGQWYYEAVLWAVGCQVTHGTSTTTFSPTKTCNRAEAVTFLYNRANES